MDTQDRHPTNRRARLFCLQQSADDGSVCEWREYNSGTFNWSAHFRKHHAKDNPDLVQRIQEFEKSRTCGPAGRDIRPSHRKKEPREIPASEPPPQLPAYPQACALTVTLEVRSLALVQFRRKATDSAIPGGNGAGDDLLGPGREQGTW